MSFQNYRKLGFTVTESDTTVSRNTLDYLILDKNDPKQISIPIVTELYDVSRFTTIVDTEFTELFPPVIVAPVDVAALLAQITALNAALSASLIVQVEPTPVEFDLWRTRKTYKRIVDNNITPYGVGNVNWNQSTWNSYASAVGKVFGPVITPNLEALLIDYNNELTSISASIANNQGATSLTYIDNNNNQQNLNYQDIRAIGQFINDQNIGSIITQTPVNNPGIITRLSTTLGPAQVRDSEINTLVWGDIPWPYYTYNNQNSNQPFISTVAEFRDLCKKLVYWNIRGTNPRTYPQAATAVVLDLFNGVYSLVPNNISNLTQARIQNQVNKIGDLEQRSFDNNPPVAGTGYFNSIP